MPVGVDRYHDNSLMQSYQQRTNESYSTADESSASILKSVQAQEAQFERLTREIEVERENIARYRLNQPRQIGEDAGSMTSADDSYMWQGGQPPSQQTSYYTDEPSQLADTSKMSSHLLDSCLKELDDRGTLNTGEDGRMDYHQEDPYSSHYNQGGGGDYGNVNASYDRAEHSPHGSHVSLQSAGSNRGRTKVGNSLPQSQQNGNYSTYQSINHPVEDLRSSPYQRSASPRYSSNQLAEHYPEAPAHYGSSPRGSVSRYDDDPRDHYDGYIYREKQYPGDSGKYPPNDSNPPLPVNQQPGYSDYEDRYPEPAHVSDSYREQNDDSYHEHPPDDANRSYGDPQNRDQSYDDRYPAPPPQYDEHDAPREPQYADDSFRGPPENSGYSYEEPAYNSNTYGSRPGEDYGHLPEDGTYPSHLDESNGDPNDSRYRDVKAEDPYSSRFENPYGGSVGPRGDEPRFRNSYQDHPEDPYADRPGDDPELIRRMEGLPPLRKDPFADDPFQDGREIHPGYRPGEENPYHRGPSPAQGRGPSPYEERAVPFKPDSYEPDMKQQYDYEYKDDPEYPSKEPGPPYYPEEEIGHVEAPVVKAPPGNEYNSEGRRSPQDGGDPMGSFRWRNPDLQEVIDYLSHNDDDIKAHAAAYLQHLTFMDDGIKAKTRGLDGIRPLIKLLSNEYPEVHKSACGALQNLSYGKTNDENKKCIRNEGGIPELIRLLRKSQEEDVRETVTGVLWNLSSCEDLKKSIIDDGLTVLVNVVILPHSGFDRVGATPYREHEAWTTTFRNATGVIRNVSSAGFESRKKIRECRGLVKAMVHTLKIATEGNMDNKPIENVVCILRNLSYRIQEIEDPDFYKKRTLPRQQKPNEKDDTTGCFGGGGGKNKKSTPKKGNEPNSPNQKVQPKFPPQANEYKGLWGSDVVHLYSMLLKNASNSVTLEAAAGAVQNLTACDWQPAVDIRALVRKEKGLPNLVDLLTFESDRVVCAAATALRNLAIDERNKELVGKYAMQQLVRKLPQHRHMPGPVAPDDTLCAVIATLYEVVKNNQDFAQSLMAENGLPRLLNITKSEGQYLARTIKYAHSVLRTMWGFRALHPEYAKMGLTEKDYLLFSAFPRPEGQKQARSLTASVSPAVSNHTTPYNTLNRPISAQGYDDNTLSPGRPVQKRPNNNYDYGRNEADGYFSMNQSNSQLNEQDRQNYSQDQGRPDEIPMTDLGSAYAPLDEPTHRTKPPPGGVPLFPSVPQHEPADQSGEPLYAKVNKKSQRNNDNYMHSSKVMLDAGGTQGGADSWV